MDGPIIDTCCLLNIFASGHVEALLAHLQDVHVSEHVKGEALWIREYNEESPPQLIPKVIDLAKYIDDGSITLCSLDDEREVELFVEFATSLDDGEASVLAIAKVRGWAVATDDRKAGRLAAEHGIPIISTAEIVHRWAESEGIEDDVVGQLLGNIQDFGRFRPRRTAPHYEWWMRLT